MRFFSFDGPFARTMGRVFDLVLLHILWLVFSIPLVTIGASTTALYTVTLKMVKNKESYILKSFVQAFRENFRQSTGLWMLLVAAFAWMLLILRICMRGDAPLLKLVGLADAAVLVGLILMALYVFPIQAQFENTLINILRNSFLCGLRYLPYSLGLLAVIAVPVLVTGFVEPVFPVMIALWLFGGSSLIAYGQSYLLVKVFGLCTDPCQTSAV